MASDVPRGLVGVGALARARSGLVVALISASLASCAGATPPVSTYGPASPTPRTVAVSSASPSLASPTAPRPTDPPPPSASSSASTTASNAASNTFVSDRYKYAITLPPGVAYVNWHRAERTWDGQARVDIVGPFTERNTIAEGGLMIIGTAAEGLDEFFARFEANGTRYHRCTEAHDRKEAVIGGVPAVAFTQVCDAGATFGRVALFKDGYAIGAYILTTPGNAIAARDRLIELLEGLEWKTG